MKTIRGKIYLNMIGAMTCLALIIGVSSAWFCMQSAVKSAQSIMTETIGIAAEEIAASLRMYETVAFEVGSIAQIADPNVDVATKKAIIDQRVASHGFARGNIVGLDGISIIDGLDLSDREYFRQALNGNTWISDPLVSKANGEVVIIVSAPIWKNGDPQSKEVVGVVYFTGSDLLTEHVQDIKVGNSGITYVIDKNGVTIAHTDTAVAQARTNNRELAQSDKQLEQLARMEGEMLQGKSGFGEFKQDGKNRFLAYAPIDVPEKWGIGVCIDKSELLAYTNASVFKILVISLGLLLFFSLISRRLAKVIAGPISRVTKRLELVAKGDLHTPVQIEVTRDETQLLSESTKKTVDQLNIYIEAIGMALRAISEGDLTVEEPPIVFEGDFVKLETSVNQILVKLNKTIADMQRHADQVAAGSDQVSYGSQTLSGGACEQANSIETLTDTLSVMSQQIHRNAQNSKSAMEQTELTARQVQDSNAQMQRMAQAMDDISAKSGEISKIIKTIEDIAFQTNILALNAAVEAARAGAAGKGFAVVADEVRSLAGKSAEAAKTTAKLIEETVHAVDTGTKIAGDMEIALHGVVSQTTVVTGVISQISHASEQQADAITQVSQNVNQISGVVQQNSATAEQSAAASEELSAQAQSLKQIVGTFKIKSEDDFGI